MPSVAMTGIWIRQNKKIEMLCMNLKTLKGMILESNSKPRTQLMKQLRPESCKPQKNVIR